MEKENPQDWMRYLLHHVDFESLSAWGRNPSVRFLQQALDILVQEMLNPSDNGRYRQNLENATDHIATAIGHLNTAEALDAQSDGLVEQTLREASKGAKEGLLKTAEEFATDPKASTSWTGTFQRIKETFLNK